MSDVVYTQSVHMYMLSAIIETSHPVSLFLNSINSEDKSTNSVKKTVTSKKNGTYKLNRLFKKSYKFLILSIVDYVRDKHVCVIFTLAN